MDKVNILATQGFDLVSQGSTTPLLFIGTIVPPLAVESRQRAEANGKDATEVGASETGFWCHGDYTIFSRLIGHR